MNGETIILARKNFGVFTFLDQDWIGCRFETFGKGLVTRLILSL